MDSETTASRARRVDDHAGVSIGRVDDEGFAIDFAGVRIGRVLDNGIVEDFAGVHIGNAVEPGAPRHAAAA